MPLDKTRIGNICMFVFPFIARRLFVLRSRISAAPTGNRKHFIAGWRRGRLIRPTDRVAVSYALLRISFRGANAVQPLAASRCVSRRWQYISQTTAEISALPAAPDARCNRRWPQADAVDPRFQQSARSNAFSYVVAVPITHAATRLIERRRRNPDRYAHGRTGYDGRSAGQLPGFIVREHHVAIPAYRAAGRVQQQPWHVEHGGGNFAGNHFSGDGAAASVHSALTAGGVAHVELIGADGVAFRADANSLPFNGRCGAPGRNSSLMTSSSACAGAVCLNGQTVMSSCRPIQMFITDGVPSRSPKYAETRRPVCSDDPELANFRVWMRVRQNRQRSVDEKTGVEIQPSRFAFAHSTQRFKMPGFDLVASNRRIR